MEKIFPYKLWKNFHTIQEICHFLNKSYTEFSRIFDDILSDPSKIANFATQYSNTENS
jgi:hypothetical protein